MNRLIKPDASVWLHAQPLTNKIRGAFCPPFNLLSAQYYVHSKKCWVKYNPVLGKYWTEHMLGCFQPTMFNPTFWAVTQPLGLNNPIAGFIHILPSAGLYWTQHFLECGCLFYSILLFSHWMIPFMLPHHLTFNAKFEVLCISTIDVLNTQCVKYIIWHIMHWLNSFLSHRVCLYDF